MITNDSSLASLFDELKTQSGPIRAALVYRLSDPSPEDLTYIRAIWTDLPVRRRSGLMTRIQEASEASFELDFTDLALFCLDDPEPEIRRLAIETAWYQEDVGLMQRLIGIMEADAAADVRAAAATALGRFVYAGELEELDPAAYDALQLALLSQHKDTEAPIDVRRRALEAISFSGNPDVEAMIELADQHENQHMRVSATFAMGRNGGSRWHRRILEQIESDDPEIRFEAVRAAGELGISNAVERVGEIANESERELQQVAIWALGEIGGVEAQNLLTQLAQRYSQDEDVLEEIEDALSMAMLSEAEFDGLLLDFSDEFGIFDDEDED